MIVKGIIYKVNICNHPTLRFLFSKLPLLKESFIKLIYANKIRSLELLYIYNIKLKLTIVLSLTMQQKIKRTSTCAIDHDPIILVYCIISDQSHIIKCQRAPTKKKKNVKDLRQRLILYKISIALWFPNQMLNKYKRPTEQFFFFIARAILGQGDN